MNVATTTPHNDDLDDLPAEVGFTNATRGKFYKPKLRLNLPVYLDAEVKDYLNVIATKKRVALSQLANDLLKREIEIIEAVKQPKPSS